jgi:hypothetical protein
MVSPAAQPRAHYRLLRRAERATTKRGAKEEARIDKEESKLNPTLDGSDRRERKSYVDKLPR